MPDSLKILDIQSLVDFGSKYREFRKKSLANINEINRELKEVTEWIQNRIIHWQAKTEKANVELSIARENLYRCQCSGYTDKNGIYHPPNCSYQEAILKKAVIEFDHCKKQLDTAQLWNSKISQSINEYRKKYVRFARLLNDDSKKMLNELGQLISGYQDVADYAKKLGSSYQGDIPLRHSFNFDSVENGILQTDGQHGPLFNVAKKAKILEALQDPSVASYIKGWYKQEIRRVGLNGYWRNPPGIHLGHKNRRVDKDTYSQLGQARRDRPENLRFENADMNVFRGGKFEKNDKE